VATSGRRHHPPRQSLYTNARYEYPSREPKENKSKSGFFGSVFGTLFCQPKLKKGYRDQGEETERLLHQPYQPPMQQRTSHAAHHHHSHRRKHSDQSYQSHRSSHNRKPSGSAAGSLGHGSSARSSPRKSSHDGSTHREKREMVDRRIERDFGDAVADDEKQLPTRPRRKSNGEREVAFVSPLPTTRGHDHGHGGGHRRKRSKDVDVEGVGEAKSSSARRRSGSGSDPVGLYVNGSTKRHSRRSKRYMYDDEYLVPIVEEGASSRDGYGGSAGHYGYETRDYSGYGYGDEYGQYNHSHGYGTSASAQGHSERRRRRMKGSGAPEEDYAAYYYN
jgi:hypothetical protein